MHVPLPDSIRIYNKDGRMWQKGLKKRETRVKKEETQTTVPIDVQIQRGVESHESPPRLFESSC
jgi:hypothetical protein